MEHKLLFALTLATVLAAGMPGTPGIGPVNADLNVSFDKVVQNFKMGAMVIGPWHGRSVPKITGRVIIAVANRYQ